MREDRSIVFYYVIGLIFIVISSSVIGWLYYQQYLERLQLHQYKTLEKLEMQFNSTAAHYQIIADTLFENILNKPEVTAIMAEAVTADADRQAVLREQLYTLLRPLYVNLKKQSIHQFHFHLPGVISFLRLHRPDKFGDDISPIRDTIIHVNASREKAYGFEGGRVILDGFRNVYPLFHNEQFVGTVELSYPFLALRKEAMRTYPAHYHTIFKLDMIKKKVWEKDQENYRVSDLDPAYYYNKKTIMACPLSGGISDGEINRINTQIAPSLPDALSQRKSVIKPASLDERNYQVAFIPIFNFKQEHAGYYVVYLKDKEIAQMHDAFRNQALLVSIANFAIIVLLILYLRSTHIKQKMLHKMATTDVLTNIPNRNHFITIFEHEFLTSQRYAQPLSLILFDIDHFKLVNDTYGHDIGDKILIEVADLIRVHVRQSDLFARWGGEEFAIILPKTGAKDARIIAEKLRKRLEEHTFTKSNVTCSFGVSQMHDSDSKESFMKRVDTLLYEAKKKGRNRVESDAVE